MTIDFSDFSNGLRDAITPPPTRSWVAPLNNEDLEMLLVAITTDHEQTPTDIRDHLGEDECYVLQQILVGMVVAGFARADYFDGERLNFQFLEGKDPTGFDFTSTNRRVVQAARRLKKKFGMDDPLMR